MRSLKYTLPSIKQHCLHPIVSYLTSLESSLSKSVYKHFATDTYDIFLHTYNFSGVYSNFRNYEANITLNFSEYRLLKPDYFIQEDQDEFDKIAQYEAYQSKGDPWDNDFFSVKNEIRALHSLYKVELNNFQYKLTIIDKVTLEVEKISKTKHYDGVIFLRPDVLYINNLPVYLFHMRKYQNNSVIFVPDFQRSCKPDLEVNDRMAMGDIQSMIKYGKRYEQALNYSKRKPLTSEKFAYDFLKENKIETIEIPFRFKRLRTNGFYILFLLNLL